MSTVAARAVPLDAGSRGWALASAGLALLPLLATLPPALGAGFAATALGVAAIAWWFPVPGWLRVLLTLAMLMAVVAVMGTHPGRDTGSALLAAMLAIKPAELRSLRDARSLVGFALFAPFAAFLLEQGPMVMVAALAAVLAGLLTLQRLADLEASIAPPALGARLATLGRLVAIGLPLALVAFWLFPRLGSPLWGVPDRAVAQLGLSDSMSPGDWVDLMVDDAPAMRVQFDGAAPAADQLYWRGPVFMDYDGRTWARARWLEALPPPQVESGPVRWRYQLDVEASDRRDLPALDLATSVPEGAHLTHGGSLVTGQSLSAPSRWLLQSAAPVVFEPDLRRTLRERALALPDGFDPRTRALARQWRAEAGSDDAAIIERALAWIRADFGYTLDTALPGRDAIDEFLFQTRRGYCEHFSSAFTVLMRAAGIPARVVTGYAGGYRNPLGDYWIVRKMDAHAWVEVWLDGRGWVRIDPTAAVAPERIYDTLEQRVAGGGALEGLALGNVHDVGDWLRRGWNDLVLGFDAERQQALLSPLGLQLAPAHLLGLFVAFAALALAGMIWLLARGERERDPLLRAWHRLGRRYATLGLGRAAHEPALAWAERVIVAHPAAAPELRTLSQRFADARYSRGNGGTRQLVKDLRRHRP
ncbi:transglutaminase TgpA family protein [Pseudoxanthomonas sp. 10H]|uniref:transglutaminase TgpA family protein n=1 Tax=Pseudoxanthomonas sp. 10H TaxID=3242729 RepID=UPI0035567FE1